MLELSKETEDVENKYIYSAKEIWELCNTSKQTWYNFVSEFLSKVNFTQKTDYLEEHPSRSGGNKYTEKTLKTFQAWLMRNKANQGNNSNVVKSIVKSAVKNDLVKTEYGDWMSKKELMDFCKCSSRVLEQIISKLNCEVNFAIQSHIKKGGYHNSEVFYDDYLVKLIQAKLLSNQTNQGNNSSIVKEIVKSAVKNEENWYSVKEICDICNTSRQSWINFKNDFNCKTGFTVKRNLKEGDKNVDYYSEDILKTFQAWLMRNQTNQGKTSDTIKSIVKSAVKNELTKTLSKDEIKLELARNKTLQMQYKAQKQIITEQERTKREQIRSEREQIIAKRKEIELEILRQKNINKAL